MGANTSTDTTESNPSSVTSVPDDFSTLLSDDKFYDVTIVTTTKEFHAHKAILAARSSVFSAMFDHEMQEKHNNCLRLPDISEEIMTETLRYIYTNQVNNMETMSKELLAISHKYMLEGLKTMCVDSLRKSIEIENVLEILVIADFYDIEELKMCAMKFVRDNAKKVIETSDFKRLKCWKPELLQELYCDLAMNHTPSVQA